MKDRVQSIVLPLLVAVVFVTGWHFAVKITGSDIFPTPRMVVAGLIELAQKGVLIKYIIASLFRVFSGFLLAVFIGIPFGLLLGWFSVGHVVVGTMAAFLVGGVAAAALLVTGRAGRKSSMAFGPSMCAGLFVALVWTEPLLDGFLGR